MQKGRLFLTFASLAQAIKALKRPHLRLFCLETGSIPGRSTFFPANFFFLPLKISVKAAKSKCLSSQCDEIHLQSFCASKDGAGKTVFSFCLDTLFIENEAQINKTNYPNDAFHVKASQSAKN